MTVIPVSFLFALMETSAYLAACGRYFPLFQKGNLKRTVFVGILWVLAGTVLLYFYRNTMTHYWHYAVLHFLFTFVSLVFLTAKDAKDLVLPAVLLEGGTHFLEHAVGNLCVIAFGSVFYMTDPFSVWTIPADLFLFLLYSLSLYFLSRIGDRGKEGTFSRRISFYLLGIYALLVVFNDLTVRLMRQGSVIDAQMLSLAVFEVLWYSLFAVSLFSVTWLERAWQQKQELDTLNTVMQMQTQQYEFRAESVEELAKLTHDMRRHLGIVGLLRDEEKRKDYIRSVEKELDVMDVSCDTGNETLNVILREQLLRCRKAGIAMIVSAQGELLSFLPASDLVLLFTGALDCAVEAVQALPAEQYREISLRVGRVRDWIVIRLCASGGEQEEETARVRSRRVQEDLPGYGLESIRAVCEKYGGEMRLDLKSQVFLLTEVIPLPAKNDTAEAKTRSLSGG